MVSEKHTSNNILRSEPYLAAPCKVQPAFIYFQRNCCELDPSPGYQDQGTPPDITPPVGWSRVIARMNRARISRPEVHQLLGRFLRPRNQPSVNLCGQVNVPTFRFAIVEDERTAIDPEAL